MGVGRRIPFLFLAVILLPIACRNKDLLETELRTREIQNRELMEELERLDNQKNALENELQSIRKGWTVPPEFSKHTFTVQRIVLGKLTGGQDTDGNYGDDALQVVVEPRDASDQAVRAPGKMHVLALEINPQGIKVPFSSWDISPAELGRTWKTGLLSHGYVLTLPWKTWPTSENIRVVVRMILPDGRAFETDKDIKIRLAPGMRSPRTPGGELHPDVPLPGPVLVPDQTRKGKRPPAVGNREKSGPGLWQGPSLIGSFKMEQPVPLNQP